MNKIKNLTLSLLLASMAGVSFSQNGLENVIVERYYISNAADATGSIGALPVGSVTYRVYADLLPGYKFQAMYGVPGHTMNINTTTTFFNNEDRGNTNPAIGAAFINDNSVAIDSWFSAGGAANGNLGILKSEDDGVANIITGNPMLLNNNPEAGIPLMTQDGIVAGAPVAVTFVGLSAAQLEVFNATSQFGNSFTTSNGSVAALGGSVGPVPATNKVLIGQFTTDGTFHFDLNIQIGTPVGGTQNFVATAPIGSEISIPSLIFTSTPIAPMTTVPTVSYCVGATASALTANASPDCTLNWYTVPTGGIASSTAPTPSTATAGVTTYYVSQTNSASNESIRTPIAVTINALPSTPVISTGSATTFCMGGSVTLTSSFASGNMWSTTAATNTISVSTSGSYTVTETDVNGCTATSAATSVTVNPLPSTPTISTSGATTFCAGGSVTLTSSDASGNMWSTTEITNTISVLTSGSFTVTETDINGCTATSAATTVTVNPLPSTPTISTSGATTFCAGGSVTLTSSAASGNTWSTTATTNSIAAPTSGSYTVTETDVNGCSATSTATTVTVNPSPVPAGSVASTVGFDVTFANTSTGATSYTWNFGDMSTSSATAPTHTYPGNAIYTVTLIASNGTCMDSVTFTVDLSTVGISATQTVSDLNLYPNPLTDEATIEVNLKEATRVSVYVYDITGKIVGNVYEGEMNSGTNKLKVDASNLDSGIYYTAIVSKNDKKTLKMIVIK